MSARGPGMPLRDARVHRYVNAFCPLCHEEHPDRPLREVTRLSGWLAIRDDRVWLERGCADHGLVRTLYDESPEILAYLEQWTAPTKVHAPDLLGNFAPVPAAYADGLPEMQTQHTCILLEDLLDHCNLKCPTCFAESSPARAGVAPLRQVLDSIDTRISRENGRIDVLMLSGGEPTLYPWLAELLDEVARAADRAGPDQHQRAPHRPRRLIARPARATSGAGRGLPAVRRPDSRSIVVPPRRGHPPVQGAGDRPALRTRHLHHSHDDRRARGERRRDRVRGQARAGHAVRRRGDRATRLRQRTKRRHRPDGPADPHRCAGAAGAADRRCRGVARLDGAAVQPPALLLGGLPAQGRRRHLAVAGLADRSRAAPTVARPGAGPAGEPDRRRRPARRPSTDRQGIAARPALGAVQLSAIPR